MKTGPWGGAAAALAVVFWLSCGEGGSPVAGGVPDTGSTAPKDDGGTSPVLPGVDNPDASVPDGGPKLGQPSPWHTQTFGRAEGILESPVVGTSTDEAQNLWVATPAALYLIKPRETAFRRFDASDGLHLESNPVRYCDSAFVQLNPDGTPIDPSWQSEGFETGTPVCPIYGSANARGIAEITGGAAGEVFVGYHGNDGGSGSKYDPNRHSGKLDRVRLNGDGTLQVVRMDFVSTNNTLYWHNRTVQRLLYDHLLHPHELYVGTNHGVDLILPDRYRDPAPGEWFNAVNLEWMSDHLHARVCYHTACQPNPNGGSEAGQRMGDWRGLALALNGDLWTAGKWTAGSIRPVEDSYRTDAKAFMNRWATRPGDIAFSHAFGDPYTYSPGTHFINEPVFRVPQEGDPVQLSAVSVAPDGRVWFASGAVTLADGPNYGIAVYDGHTFAAYSPTGDLGAAEEFVQDLVALPDGRIALAFPNSGVLLWNPASGAKQPLSGLADPHVHRLELDTTVKPPVLHVSTNNGATVVVLP